MIGMRDGRLYSTMRSSKKILRIHPFSTFTNWYLVCVFILQYFGYMPPHIHFPVCGFISNQYLTLQKADAASTTMLYYTTRFSGCDECLCLIITRKSQLYIYGGRDALYTLSTYRVTSEMQRHATSVPR